MRPVAYAVLLLVSIGSATSLIGGYPGDCSDIFYTNSESESGVYDIQIPDTGKIIRVYCDADTPGGGWTVIQRRMDGSENFFRNWTDYALGFGNIEKEFWIGNDNLAALTSSKTYLLRIELGDWKGQRRYAEYRVFNISGSEDNYRIQFGGYSGDAGDSLKYHRGREFSTYDQDHDLKTDGNCAETFRGAWWYNDCLHSNLNGEYGNPEWGQGVNWFDWLSLGYPLKFTEMKISPDKLE